ncbi:ATP-dependent RNA helicase TDRD9-like isoform X1 [Ictalurus furcatus]|uniref:ATP-dependent RNA helicase TDRD9-like isoform X1 n=1 Tax=Ictalurus furcatus TaxID=66913 RepID=UPI00234FBF7B|nr:ATP-dependent RNA helicase TDRD9-like isoform X1 [Ictalurus furcatus]
MHISETSPSDYTGARTQKFIVQVAIAGAFYPNCFLQGTVDEELASKELYGNDPRTTIVGLCRVLPLVNERFWRSPRSLSVSPPRAAETSSPSQRLTRWRGGDLGRGVIEVGHFWGFQAHEASLEKQRWLTVAVNTRALRPLPVSLYPNLLCLAPFSETHTKPGNYYRAKILHVMGSNVEVFFVDFGNTSKVPCNSLWNFLLTGKLCPFRLRSSA